MDIKTLSLQELKAYAYDQMVALEQAQINLRAANEEIGKRLIEEKAE